VLVAGAGWPTRGRAGRSTSSPDSVFVTGGWRVRAEARRFQLLEIVRPKAQSSHLQNPPKHHVTEREEHEASSVARQLPYSTRQPTGSVRDETGICPPFRELPAEEPTMCTGSLTVGFRELFCGPAARRVASRRALFLTRVARVPSQ